jgi:hypothetical protein
MTNPSQSPRQEKTMKVFLFMGYYGGGPSYIMALERTGLGPCNKVSGVDPHDPR